MTLSEMCATVFIFIFIDFIIDAFDNIDLSSGVNTSMLSDAYMRQ